MNYETLEEVIAGKLVEKCVAKYLSGCSRYLYEEAVQHCYLELLEAINKGKKIKCLECYTINLVRNQVLSKTSSFYKNILSYERTKVQISSHNDTGEDTEQEED